MNPRQSAALSGTLCYLLASIFWGMNIPLTAKLLESFDPFWVSPVRYLIASALLGLWVVATMGPSQLRSPIAATRLALLSLSVSVFLMLFNFGILYTHTITAAAILAGSPVYVAVVSRFMTGARLERGFWGATALTLLGAGIAIQGRASSSGQGLGLRGGELLLVLSIVSWTVYSILAQRWFTPQTSQLRRTFLSSMASVPWLLLFWALARAIGLVGPPNLSPSPQALTYLVVTAVCATALATLAWNTGVARLGVQVGALWQNMTPVFAVLISLLFFEVVPTTSQVIGGLVVLSGVLYLQWWKLKA